MMTESLILVADGSKKRREQAVSLLSDARLAGRVIACNSGRRLVTEYTRALQRGAQVRAVWMELSLPIVGGKTASIALRCIEKALGGSRVPILFLSDSALDAKLKRVLDYIKHAQLLSRSDGGSMEGAISKLREMIS